MSPVESPKAPWSIAFATSFFIFSSCFGSGCTSSKPSTAPRTWAAPTSTARLIEGRALRRRRKYPERSVQSTFNLNLRRKSSFSRTHPAVMGAGETPSPVSSVVMPWRIFDSARGSTRTSSSLWPRRSMKPGQRTSPRRSMRRRARAFERSPTEAMRPARMPRTQGAPVPSTTRPFEKTRSKIAAATTARIVMPAARPPPPLPRRPLRPPRRGPGAPGAPASRARPGRP